MGARNDVWKTWTAALLWLGLIVVESTEWLSSRHTASLLYPLLTLLFGHIKFSTFQIVHHILRKTGHVVGYGMLSFLLFRAWRATFPLPNAVVWAVQWARIAFFMSALVASLDEWHQSYLPSRTGDVGDILLDSVAALAVQVLLFVVLRQRRVPARKIV